MLMRYLRHEFHELAQIIISNADDTDDYDFRWLNYEEYIIFNLKQ